MSNCRYLKFIFALIRGGKISANSRQAGKNITLGRDVVLAGLKYMSVGERTSIGEHSVITAYKVSDYEPKFIIGNNCSIGSYNHITCINEVLIDNGLLTGRWVTITDNSHGKNTLEEISVEPWKRQLYSKGGVIIGKNVWLGDKVTVLPGVTIGDGVIVGANSVVTKDIPSYCVACGNPAKVVKKIK